MTPVRPPPRPRSPAARLALRTAAIAWVALAGLGCERGVETVEDPPPIAPPSGRGTRLADDGSLRTLFVPLDHLAYGDVREGTGGSATDLLGYTFSARIDDAPRVSLELSGDGRIGLALYGPQDARGLWDEALVSADAELRGDARTLVLEASAIEHEGDYFILVRNLDGRARPGYRLTLTCTGACERPSCPAPGVCDRVCLDGFVRDAGNCRVCECVQPRSCDPPCGANERCEAGRCVAERTCESTCPVEVDLVCGDDGQTHRNRCIAACGGVAVVSRGRCPEPTECDDARPCPDGRICQSGACVEPPCECPPGVRPVCSEEGRTHRSRCALECAEETLAYSAACVTRRCEDASGCPMGWLCAAAPEVPENREWCAQADDPRCVRRCAPPPAVIRCTEEMPCPAREMVCYGQAGDAPGLCLLRCAAGREDPAAGCPSPAVCVAIDARAPERGACLPSCDPEAGRACTPPFQCRRDVHQTAACQLCACPEAQPDEHVCAGERVYRSACLAECDGQFEHRPGNCAPPPPDCSACVARDAPLICGEDGLLYATPCELRCRGQMAARETTCEPEAVPRRCATDEHCHRTGCDGQVCASGRNNTCPDYSPHAACYAEHGTCGCIEGRCGFRASRETFACANRGGPPPDADGE